jgi:hypothetical protein
MRGWEGWEEFGLVHWERHPVAATERGKVRLGRDRRRWQATVGKVYDSAKIMKVDGENGVGSPNVFHVNRGRPFAGHSSRPHPRS